MYLFRVVIGSFQCSRGRVGKLNLAYVAHSARLFQPRIEFGRPEIPVTPDLVRGHLSVAGHALQRLDVHPAQQLCGIFIVQKRLKTAAIAGCGSGVISTLIHSLFEFLLRL
jgi:hypothetical protein